jgi:quercetin dioxygenase-like cupin family protein
MKHVHFSDVKLEEPSEEGVKDMKVRWLITKNDGAKNFAMRLFEIQPGGHSPYHQHDWEHEVFILEGNGIAKNEKNQETYKQGDVFFIPPMEWHQFVNTGKKLTKFLCLIPYKK